MDPLLASKLNSRNSNKAWFVSGVVVIAIVTGCVCLLNTPASLSSYASYSEINMFDTQALKNLFEQWKLTYSKSYATAEEEAYRFKVFVEAYEYITNHNSKGDTVVLGLTKFADLTNEEFRAQYVESLDENAKDQDHQLEEFSMESSVGALPAEWDWRKKGVVTPVMNQGQCGSSYIFATVSALEGYYAIKNGNLIQFSYQQVLDCDTAEDGCSGGGKMRVLNYTAKYGIEPYYLYPYTGGKVGTCQYSSSLTIKANVGSAQIPPKNVNLLQTAVYGAPVSIDVETDQPVFQYYTGGVITTGCGAQTDRCGTVVGWTNYNGTNAWIVKNSWGTNWGLDGYVLIGMDGTANGGQGVCGILTAPVVPV